MDFIVFFIDIFCYCIQTKSCTYIAQPFRSYWFCYCDIFNRARVGMFR